jgi:hypothetical protein
MKEEHYAAHLERMKKQRGRPGPHRKETTFNGITYPSREAAADALGLKMFQFRRKYIDTGLVS